MCTTIVKLGDELYEAEFYEEIPQGTSIEKEIDVIVLDLLRDFSFLKDDEEYEYVDDDDNDDEECVKEMSATQNTSTFKSNYFQKQLRFMATKYGVRQGGDGDDDGDNMSDVTAKVFSHPTVSEIAKTMDERRLCQKRDFMEKIAACHQRKQGEGVNRKRAKVSKPFLDVGDIGLIEVEGNTRAATDHKWLPVMVTSTRLVAPENVMYKLCTQHGHLGGEFVRGDIYPHPHMTAELLKINPMTPNFEKNLSIASASAKYNALGGATVCRCKSNCFLNKRCSCMNLGKLCSAKCHGKRKEGNTVKCDNCFIHCD